MAGTGSFGAGSQLEVADARDGLLDVAVLEAGSRFRLVRYAYGLRAHRLTAQAGVRHVAGARIRLELDEETTLNVDGELIRAGPVIELHVEREAFRLVGAGSGGRRLAVVVVDLVLAPEPEPQATARGEALEGAHLAGVELEHDVGLAVGREGEEADSASVRLTI